VTRPLPSPTNHATVLTLPLLPCNMQPVP
jgi:hypothetical protein